MAQLSINPHSGETLASFQSLSPGNVPDVLADVAVAWRKWRATTFRERSRCLHAAARVLREDPELHASAITQEMGKPIRQARFEVEKCAMVCDYYADHAEMILAEELVSTDATKSLVRFDPIGCVLAVMPWNFPYWQVFRFAAPALMAGNVGVLKHASNVPRCALLIEDVFRQAGVVPDGFRTLLLDSSSVAAVIAHPTVRAVTLTGSEPAGASVAAAAGAALKKTVLELGGSDPFIVLADADLPRTAAIAADARLQNTGQSCIAAKRFIVEEAVADEFIALFAAEIAHRSVGDPMLDTTDVGPLARPDLVDDLERQIAVSVERGARIHSGCRRIPRPGNYFEPGILLDVQPGMPAYDEELFGPVASLIVARDQADAVRIANDTEFGLGASLWTQDMANAEVLAQQIEAGSVFVNGMVKSDPRLPFGGIGRSGYGRELSAYGIKEFVNIKTVWMR